MNTELWYLCVYYNESNNKVYIRVCSKSNEMRVYSRQKAVLILCFLTNSVVLKELVDEINLLVGATIDECYEYTHTIKTIILKHQAKAMSLDTSMPKVQ